MGTWGPSLYSSDTASDFRAMIGVVLKLPFDDEKVVEVVCEREPKLANDPADEEHTIFWLVLADQFAKRGVASARVLNKAIAIIDEGSDLKMHEKLGLRGAGLRKRADALSELRARLAAAPTVSRPRATMKSPQPYVMDLATLYAAPTKGSAAINPSRGRKNFDGSEWIPDGFRQLIILERGLAFGYLAWYQPLVTIATVKEKPTLEAAMRSELWWRLESPKTCSPKEFKTMEIQAIGAVPVDFDKARARFPRVRPGIVFLGWEGVSAAIYGQSISDTMWPSSHDWADLLKRGTPPVEGPTVIQTLSGILA